MNERLEVALAILCRPVAQRKYQNNDSSMSPFVYPTESEALAKADALIREEENSRPKVYMEQHGDTLLLIDQSHELLLEHKGAPEHLTARLLQQYALQMIKDGLTTRQIKAELESAAGLTL